MDATAGLSYEEWRALIDAVGHRNREALDAAKASGSDTWLRKELQCVDGKTRTAWRQVPVVRDDEGDFKLKFIADDGTVSYGAEADAGMAAEIDATQEDNRQVLARLKPHELARFETWLRTRTHATPPVRPGSGPATSGRVNGRAPREARNDRHRGSRRGGRATSSSSDDPDSDPEPPSRRLCAFCGKDIPASRSARAAYCSDRHADRDRQRRKRHRDRERDLRPPTPQPADFWRMQQITDEELVELHARVECRCNGRHVEFDPGECFRCGHWLPHEVAA